MCGINGIAMSRRSGRRVDEGVLRRIVQASSAPGDWCLDPFAGSGTLGAVAAGLGRRYLLVDSSDEAVRVMRRRLGA